MSTKSTKTTLIGCCSTEQMGQTKRCLTLAGYSRLEQDTMDTNYVTSLSNKEVLGIRCDNHRIWICGKSTTCYSTDPFRTCRSCKIVLWFPTASYWPVQAKRKEVPDRKAVDISLTPSLRSRLLILHRSIARRWGRTSSLTR